MDLSKTFFGGKDGRRLDDTLINISSTCIWCHAPVGGVADFPSQQKKTLF